VVLGFFTAGIRDFKYGVIALLPVVAAGLFALSLVNSQFFHLPRQVQRGLAFLPGDWDADMKRDATASNDFRQKLWTVFLKNYFPLHPFIGRGFGFRSQIGTQSVHRYNPNWDLEAVEVGNIHNGFLATLDTVGIIGFIFFVAWNLRLLMQTFRVSFLEKSPAGAALRFLALYLAVQILSYGLSANNVGSFLPQEFAVAGVFLRLKQTLDSERASGLRVEPSPRDSIRPDLVPA
jgi:O-antigen ligase